MTRDVIIAGAGIGGLTAALCCVHQGLRPIVLERAQQLGEVGAGIQIPPNAMKVFRALGIADQLSEAGFYPQAIEARMGKSGRSIFSVPLNADTERRWGAPYLHIHRADYIRVLSEALTDAAPEALRLGKSLTGYEIDGANVTVQLADGTEVKGDVLVGADGIQSVVRNGLQGATPANFTGNVAWRAVVPIDKLGKLAPPPTACLWMGPGGHAVTYRLRGGKLANLVAVVEREDWREEGWAVEGTRAEALADFEGWHPIIREILNRAKSLNKWALFDRPPLPFWSQNRVTLLGDAAHPMLPFLAQGAAMAVEDAWVLAGCLKEFSDVEIGLSRYEDVRKPRTTKAQMMSAANAKTFHKRTTPAQLAAYGPMWIAGKLLPNEIYRRQDWLYCHDVTN